MDTSARLPSLLHSLPFLILQCLGFIPSMYIIGMIQYYILEYFDVQRFSALFLFMFTSFPFSVVWGFFKLWYYFPPSNTFLHCSLPLIWLLTMLLMMSWTFKSCFFFFCWSTPKERFWGKGYMQLTVSMLFWNTITFSSLYLGETSYCNSQLIFPAHLIAIHLNLWDNGFSFCPLGGDEHQENSVQNLGMRGKWTILKERSNLDCCHPLLLCLACATALGNSQQLLLSLLFLLFLFSQMHQTHLEDTFNRHCISLIHDLWSQTFMISKSLPWTVILSPMCLNKLSVLAYHSWRKEIMVKIQGFSEKSCLGKL